MALSDLGRASLALRRFGLGPRPGDLTSVAGDPQGALLSELSYPEHARLDGGKLVASNVAYAENRAAEEQRRVARAAAAATNTPVAPDPGTENTIYNAEAQARFARLATTANGLQERLVLFWSNHFAVALTKGNEVRVMAGPFEREAIRPHILGRFVDMLRAVETHPAMLFYLDNNQSIGPNSRNGISSKRGLNENLAREILELHTLGVDGGYTQADVTSLARIITGWTVTQPDTDALYGGRFTFAPTSHEPGIHVLLGTSYPATGLEQGEMALADIAIHPSTARHIARQLATHFVADNPPPALIDRLAQTFRDTAGDLAEVTRVLVTAPEAWATDASKLRSPVEFVVAAARLTGKTDPGTIMQPLPALGQPLWSPSGPNGFSDRTDAWATPEGLKTRLDVAARIGDSASAADPMVLLAAATGDSASDATRTAMQRAASRSEAVAILLMSPEFQRR